MECVYVLMNHMTMKECAVSHVLVFKSCWKTVDEMIILKIFCTDLIIFYFIYIYSIHWSENLFIGTLQKRFVEVDSAIRSKNK